MTEERNIVLWYRNRADKDKLYTFDEIADGFLESEFYSDYKKEMYPSIQQALVHYITMEEGLNSSYEVDMLDPLLGHVIKRHKEMR